MPQYADIVLPLAQPAYTFAVPEGMAVTEGQAVAVQFGARKFYTGIVWRLHDRRPDFPRIKSIQRILYDRPLLTAPQRALWEWIASYYLCSVGEVMRVALPSLMKPSGDTEEEFSEEEFRPRTECYLALARELHDEAAFHEVCERLERRARGSTRRCSRSPRRATRTASRRVRWRGVCCGPTTACCTPWSERGMSWPRSASGRSNSAVRCSACRS